MPFNFITDFLYTACSSCLVLVKKETHRSSPLVFGHCFKMVRLASYPFSLVSGTVESRNVLSTIVSRTHRRRENGGAEALRGVFVRPWLLNRLVTFSDVSVVLIRYDRCEWCLIHCTFGQSNSSTSVRNAYARVINEKSIAKVRKRIDCTVVEMKSSAKLF